MPSESIYKVELSHNQLSLLQAVLLQYQKAWDSKGELPEYVADLITSTRHQLMSCSQQE
jgi:hypothetical protein